MEQTKFYYSSFQYYGDFEKRGKNHVSFLFQANQPVYKPGQTIRAQCCIISSSYLTRSISTLGNKKWGIKVYDPMGNQIDIGEQTVTSDATGAFPFEYTQPKHAKLGSYSVNIDLKMQEK